MNFWQWLLSIFTRPSVKSQEEMTPVVPPTKQPEAPKEDHDDPPWLRAAYAELGVAEIPGAASNPRIVQYHQSTTLDKELANSDETPWCLNGETEILTERGWVRLDSLSKDDRVAQSNNGLVEFVLPVAHIKVNYSGRVAHIKNRDLDVTCDINHQWFGRWNSATAENRKAPISEIGSSLSIPTVKFSNEIDRQDLSDRDIQLLAAFISDGFLHRGNIEIQVSKQRKIDYLRGLGPKHEYKANKVYGKSKQPLTTISFNLLPEKIWSDIFQDYKELKWSFIFSLSRRQISLFIDTFLQFDGHAKGGSLLLYSSRETLRDQLSCMVTLTGYHSSINYSISKISGRPCYSVRFCKDKKTRTIQGRDVAFSDQEIDLFCVTVPSGLIVCRDQSGTPFVTGNCSSFTNFCLTQAGRAGTNSAWAKSFLKWGVPLDIPRRGCIAVFTRGHDGGHVGFYIKEIDNKILVLSGNQSNKVCEAFYPKVRLISYRWPKGRD